MRIQTRKCMLRPNSFSLFTYILSTVPHESSNHRPTTSLFFGLQNASCCLVVVAFSLFLLVAHTCIIIIIYCKCRGVIFFILCFFGTFSLIRITFIFWFWHFSRYSKYSSEYDEGKNIFSEPAHDVHRPIWMLTERKNSPAELCCRIQMFYKKYENFFCRRALENCFFFLFLFICEGWFLSNYTYFFLSLSNVIMLDDKLHMCAVSKSVVVKY